MLIMYVILIHVQDGLTTPQQNTNQNPVNYPQNLGNTTPQNELKREKMWWDRKMMRESEKPLFIGS